MSVSPIRKDSPELGDEDREWVTAVEIQDEARLTYRQVDYWTRTGLLVPEGDAAPGHGNYRRYHTTELEKAKAVKALLNAGLDLPAVRRHIDEFVSGSRTVGPVTITYIPEK